jgi:hypothetical protein
MLLEAEALARKQSERDRAAGVYRRVCRNWRECDVLFETDDPSRLYCSTRCREDAKAARREHGL